MFPHTITIYHHEIINGVDTYTKAVVSGFYVYGSKSIAANGKGVEGADSYTIVSSPKNAQTFGANWNLSKGDRIIKGAGEDITSFKELTDSITAFSIDVNVIGCDCDNVTIIGK